jgi:hypothetical protein
MSRKRVLNLIRATPGLSDREITDRLLGAGSPQQGVNHAARVRTPRKSTPTPRR